MTYDFDTPIERRGTNSAKWTRYAPDVLPMFVADMDFKSPEPMLKAMHARVAHGVFGYVGSQKEMSDIVAARMKRLSQAEAEGFYAVHRERPFFKDLVAYMTSGPVVVQVLEGENAVAKNRDIMGATDPKKAAPGTIRADLAESIEANTVHGSDSLENAAREIAYFFAETDLCPR